MIFHCKTEDLYIQTFHNETVDFCVKTWHLTATTRTLTYYRQWGTYTPYASLSCIALSASFKKPRTSSVFCVSSFPKWNVKCVSSFVGENKRAPTHTGIGQYFNILKCSFWLDFINQVKIDCLFANAKRKIQKFFLKVKKSSIFV